MTRTLLWALGGTMLAAIIHIVTVLFIPLYATNDAWARLARFGPVNALHTIPSMVPGAQALPEMDPSLRYAVCPYDLRGGPLRIAAAIPPTYWVVTLHDRHGLIYYTLNDRAVAGNAIEIWVATQEQLLDLAPVQGEEDTDSRLVIGAPETSGFAMFRLLVPSPSQEGVIAAALAKSSCAIAELETTQTLTPGSSTPLPPVLNRQPGTN